MGVTCERNIEHASLWMLALKMISTTYDHHVYHECSKIVFMRLSLPTYAFSMRTPLWPIAALCCWGRLIYFYIPNMVRLTCVLTWSVCRLPVMVRGTILLLCFLLSWASVISIRHVLVPRGFSTFGSCGLEAEGFLSCMCLRLSSHVYMPSVRLIIWSIVASPSRLCVRYLSS